MTQHPTNTAQRGLFTRTQHNADRSHKHSTTRIVQQVISSITAKMTMDAWHLAVVLLFLVTATSVESHRPCDICADVGVSISNPAALVPLENNLTCGELVKLSLEGEFDQTNCFILQALEFPQSACGCSASATTPSFEHCNVCGQPQAQVTNFEHVVQVPMIGNITCLDLQNYGGFYPGGSVTCSNVATSSIPNLCGCQVFEPAPSVCETAANIGLGETIYGNTTGDYGVELFEVCSGSLSYSVSWYKFTGVGAMVTADTCGNPTWYSQVIVVTGTNCDDLACVPVNRTYPCGLAVTGEAVTWFANASQEYYVLVSSDNDFILTVKNASATVPPTMSPTASYECSICGDNDKRAIFLDVIVNVPIYGNVTCGGLQSLLFEPDNGATASTCAAVLASNVTQQMCGCTRFAEGSVSCESATTIGMGQTVHGTFRGAEVSNAYNVTNCTGSPSPWTISGLWYRAVGTGSVLSIGVCNVVGDYPNLSILTGTCGGDLTCVNLNYNVANVSVACGRGGLFGPVVSWFSNLDQDYYILLTNTDTADVAYDFALTITGSSSAVAVTQECYVCGSKDQRPAKPNTTLNLQNFFPNLDMEGIVTCGDLEFLGLQGVIDPWSCAELHYYNYTQHACGCEAVSPGPNSCYNATVITAGDSILSSTMSSPPAFGNNTYCNVTVGSPHVWYRFIGIGGDVTVDVCSFRGFQVFVMTGTCNHLSCIAPPHLYEYCSVTWKTVLGEDYLILVTSLEGGVDAGAVGDVFITLTAHTEAPSSSPTILVSTQPFPVCNICGSNNRVSLFDAIPSNFYGYYTCLELETQALSNQIHPLVCSILEKSNVSKSCGCTKPAVNNDCSTAIDFNIGEIQNGTSIVATPGVDDNFECGLAKFENGSFNPGVWYRLIVGSSSGQVLAKVSPQSPSRLLLTVYNGTCETLNCVSGNPDFHSFQNGIRETIWNVRKGSVYYIYVQSDSAGNFTLAVSLEGSMLLTSAPTPDANALYPSCNICGVGGGRVTKSHVTIDQQGIAIQGIQGNIAQNITCAELQQSALTGQIDPSACELLRLFDFPEACGCRVPGPSPTTAKPSVLMPAQTSAALTKSEACTKYLHGFFQVVLLQVGIWSVTWAFWS